MKNTIFTFLFLLLSFFVSAQFSFIKKVDLSYFKNIKITSDGGWIVAVGNVVQKFNSCGDSEWEKKYELKDSTYLTFDINDLELNSDGSILFCGYVVYDTAPFFPLPASFMSKIDSEGNPIWFNIYHFYEEPPEFLTISDINSNAFSIKKSPNGTYFISGLVDRGGPHYPYIVNINSDGEPIWSNTYVNTWTEIFPKITSSGEGLLMTSAGTFSNKHLVYKVNSQGNIVWADTTKFTETLDFIEINDGHIGLASQDSLGFSFTYKIDFEGNLIWKGQSIHGWGNKLLKTSNEKIIAISFDENRRMILSEISPDGKVVSNTITTSTWDLSSPFFSPIGADFFTDNSLLIPFSTKLIKTNPQQNLSCLDSTISIIDKEYNFSLNAISDTIATSPIPLTIYPQELVVTDWEIEIENICEEYYLIDEVIDTILCDGKKLNFDLGFPGAENFIWDNGSTSSAIEIISPGIYSVEILHCEYITTKTFNVIDGDCFCAKMPNAFTPDEDGVNDTFAPVYECEVENFDFKIFNRWGEMVFFTNDNNLGWDGKYRNQPATSDVYIYTISYIDELGQIQQQKGDVTLLR